MPSDPDWPKKDSPAEAGLLIAKRENLLEKHAYEIGIASGLLQ